MSQQSTRQPGVRLTLYIMETSPGQEERGGSLNATAQAAQEDGPREPDERQVSPNQVFPQLAARQMLTRQSLQQRKGVLFQGSQNRQETKSQIHFPEGQGLRILTG